jgi:hypothetical protein
MNNPNSMATSSFEAQNTSNEINQPSRRGFKLRFSGEDVLVDSYLFAREPRWFQLCARGLGWLSRDLDPTVDHMELYDDPPHAVKTMVDYIYKIDSIVPDSSIKLAEDLLVVTKVHLTAWKYIVRRLAEDSWDCFCELARASWVPLWEPRQLEPVIRAIYSHPDSYSHIRTAAVDLKAHHIAIFSALALIEVFHELLHAYSDFQTELKPGLVEQPKVTPTQPKVPKEIQDNLLHILATPGHADDCRKLINDG